VVVELENERGDLVTYLIHPATAAALRRRGRLR
jgi:hypothetical protein